VPGEKTVERETLTLVIEAFGIATAVAFVLSGMINAAIFWFAWRLNYFLIASPTDVVMSGFLVVTIFLAVIGSTSLWVIMTHRMSIIYIKIFNRFLEKRKTPMNPAVKTRLDKLIKQMTGWRGVAFSAAFFFIYAVVVGVVVPNRALHGGSGPVVDWSQFSYLTGMKVVRAGDQAKDCVGGPVLWLGSTNAIVRCSAKVVVLHKLDDLVTEPF